MWSSIASDTKIIYLFFSKDGCTKRKGLYLLIYPGIPLGLLDTGELINTTRKELRNSSLFYLIPSIFKFFY